MLSCFILSLLCGRRALNIVSEELYGSVGCSRGLLEAVNLRMCTVTWPCLKFSSHTVVNLERSVTPYESVSPLTGTVEIALLEYMCMEFDPSLCILRFNKHQICAISNRKTPGTIYRPAPFPWSMPCYVFILSGMTASADLPACFRNMHALQNRSLMSAQQFSCKPGKRKEERGWFSHFLLLHSFLNE